MINGVTVTENSGTSKNNCAAYASEILSQCLTYPQGVTTTTFNNPYNILKGKSAEERLITEEHVREYIQAVPVGARILITHYDSTTTDNRDNNIFGHTQVLAAKDDARGTFVILESGGGTRHAREYTYASYANKWRNYQKTAKGQTIYGYNYFFYVDDFSSLMN